MQKTVPSNIDKNNFLKRFIFGGLAGMAGKTSIAPLERIKYIYIVCL